MTKTQIIVFLAVNFITALYARLYAIEGGFKSVCLQRLPNCRRSIYYVAGFYNQADRAYQYINPGQFNIYALNFSLFGYNPKRAGEQITQTLQRSDVICGISIGAKAVEHSLADALASQVILIAPCSHPRALQPPYYYSIRILSPLAQIISFALGWISFIPLIPIKCGAHASLALIVDQLFWMGYGNLDSSKLRHTSVILSQDDEFLDNTTLKQIYATTSITVPGLHARTTDDPALAAEYEAAIHQILS